VFTIVKENSFELSDVDWFVQQLDASSFENDRDVIVTRAPGRLDVLGGRITNSPR